MKITDEVKAHNMRKELYETKKEVTPLADKCLRQYREGDEHFSETCRALAALGWMVQIQSEDQLRVVRDFNMLTVIIPIVE